MATAKWAPKRYAYTPELGDMVYGRMHLSGYDPHVTANLKLGVRIPVWECWKLPPAHALTPPPTIAIRSVTSAAASVAGV